MLPNLLIDMNIYFRKGLLCINSQKEFYDGIYVVNRIC